MSDRAFHRRRGFTLIELITVITIMAVMAATVQPRWREFLQRERLRNAAVKVAADLRLVQGEAIRLRTPAAIGFDVNRDFYMLWYWDGNNDPPKWKKLKVWGNTERSMTLLSVNPDYHAALESVGPTDPYVIFDVYGLPHADATITLGAGTSRRSVNVNGMTGKITMSDLTESGTAAALHPVIPTSGQINQTKPDVDP